MTRPLRFPVIALIILAVGSIGFGADAYAAKKKKIDRRVVEALEEFHEIVSGSEELIEGAAGVLIFPKVKKAGIGIGGEGGSGALQVDGETVGYLTSGNYGHHLGRAIGLGYVAREGGVDAEFVKSGNYEIEIAGERYAATASLRPMYDPTSERMKV
ncbi:MAG: hypothetical protein IH995_07915 [Proteobacteria bacterium]|nr:hypothetical protein [Pseudomonadota bacterium]